MPNTELYIDFEKKTGQIFNKDIGWLALPEAGNIKVSIKGYKDEKEALDKKLKEDKESAQKNRDDSQKKIDQEDKKSYEFIHQNWEDLNAGKVNKKTYDANLEERKKGIANRNTRTAALENTYQSKIAELQNEYDSSLQKIKDQYKNVRWVWQLIGSDRPNLTNTSFNEAIASGNPELSLNFDDFLEGGGAAYIEPFWEGTKPVGRYPHGIIVNATGKNPQVITADWRDAVDNEITDTLKFGSTVYLNIYTEALYGHNIKVQLKDKDQVIRVLSLGLTNADDKLFAAEYLNNNVEVEDREEADVAKKENTFIRAVSVHSTTKFPSIAKQGILVDEGDDVDDGNVKGVPNVQKCKFAVFIDPLWETLAGSELEIYPIIEHPKIPEKIKYLDKSILKIGVEGRLLKVEEITSNQVVVVSKVETNMAAFHHCGYNTITGWFKDNRYEIFERKTSGITHELSLQIITDEIPEKLIIYAPDLETEECTFNNQDDYHTNKVVSVINKPSFQNLKIGTNDIEYDIFYPKPTLYKLIDNAFLNVLKPLEYNIKFETCRFQHPLKVEIYPQVKYNFNAHIGVDEDKYLYVYQTKKYHKRKYKAKKGTNSKANRKSYNKQNKQKYKDDVNAEITKDNFASEYEFSVEYEAKFGENESISISNAVATIEQIIEKTVYIYTVIDSYTGGSKMKEAENNPEKKRQFKIDEATRKSKRGKLNLPLRFEVTPPKLTGGIVWKYVQSAKEPNRLGVEYEFKLGALPLVGVKGKLDLLFGAQFIPYINVVVKALDASVRAVSMAGEVMTFFGVGNMEADYYFDFVCSTNLNLDFVQGAKYHTIDGFSESNVSIYSEIELGLEAGGYLKVELFDIVGEAALHAETKAKFKVSWNPNRLKYLILEFEGIEAKIHGKINLENKGGENTEDNNEEPKANLEIKNEHTKKFDDVEIFKPFEVEIKLFE